MKGWAQSGRRGALLRILAGRLGSASRPQWFECPPLVSHPGWWEKGPQNCDVVGMDGAQSHLSAGSGTGARDQVRGNLQDSVGRGHFPGTGMDGPGLHKAYVGVWGRQAPRGPRRAQVCGVGN